MKQVVALCLPSLTVSVMSIYVSYCHCSGLFFYKKSAYFSSVGLLAFRCHVTDCQKKRKKFQSAFFLAAHGFDPINKILISVILTSFLIFIPIGS